jgi:hypothetical protein
MATFAPELQSQDVPNYIRLAGEPITQPIPPEPDKSKGLFLSTVGEGIQGGTEIAENLQQQNIKEKVRAGVDALRDTTSLQYEMIRNAQMTGQPLPQEALKAAGFSSSLLGQVGADVPPGLQAGIDKASDIGMALAQGGSSRANDTLYTGALNSLAKQLRNEYPGHKDFIDEQIGRISGKNPANAYMDNLLQDINRNAAAGNQNRNKLLTQAYELMKDAPGPDIQHSIWPYIKAYEAGMPGSEDNLARAVNGARYHDYQFKEWQRQRELKAANQTDIQFDAKTQYQKELATVSDRLFSQIVDIPGLSSPETVQKLIDDSREGRITLSPQQHQQLYMTAKAMEDHFQQTAKGIANQRGYASAIHDPTAEEAIRNNEAQNFHRLVEAIGNKDYGTLFEAQRNIKAMQDQTLQALYDDKDMGQYWRTVQAVTQAGGPNWANRLDSMGMQRGYLQNLQSFVNNQYKVASAPDDLRQDGKVKSMYQSLQELQDAQRRGLSDPKVIARAYKDVVHVVDGITDSNANPAVKKEIVKYAFGENNYNTLETAKMDFTDSQGKRHDGKYSVFDTLTQPNITKAVRSLGDSQAWGAYKGWTENSFARLYRDDLSNISQLGVHPGVPLRVLWDSTNNRFSLDDGKGGPLKPTEVEAFTNQTQTQYIRNATQIVNRLNSGLSNLAQVHQAEGGGPTATSEYLLSTMKQLGFDPEHVGGFPADVYEAIKNSKAKKDLSTAFEKARGNQ